MIRVGIVGIGFMGMIHYLTYQKQRGVEVRALCEKDKKRLAGDWRTIKGNFGPAGEQMDLSGIAAYTEIEDLLADDSVDLIDVTLPPALHADVVVKALRAGKHVFCEKPMALSLQDCDRMANAARSANKRLFIGHVLPYFPEYAWALKTVQSGKYGDLLGGNFRRIISDPTWLRNYWEADQVGGPMLDLHIHDAHFIRLLFGKPDSVNCRGQMKNDLAKHWNTQFDYGPQGPVVSATSGAVYQQARSFHHGFDIFLEKATLTFDFVVEGSDARYTCPPTLLTDKKAQRPQLGDGDPMRAFAGEIKEVVTCLQQGRDSEILDGKLARDAVLLCGKQSESLRRRCFVKI